MKALIFILFAITWFSVTSLLLLAAQNFSGYRPVHGIATGIVGFIVALRWYIPQPVVVTNTVKVEV